MLSQKEAPNHAFPIFTYGHGRFYPKGAMAEWPSFKYTTAYIQFLRFRVVNLFNIYLL